jgi:small-conductance mechanosensitive channel
VILALQDSVVSVTIPARVASHLTSRELFTIGGTPVTPATLAAGGLILAFTWLISLLLQRATVRGLSHRSKADPATIAVATRLVNYGVLLIGLAIALQTVGVNVGALFAAGAFFAVALGFAMQNLAQNFIAGIILMTERTIKPGDVLKVEDSVVRVTRLGLRATVARTRDEEDIIIPNSILVQNAVTNYTLRDSIIRVRATVGVSYGSDIDTVMRVLREAAEALPGRVAGFDPIVLLTGFGESSVNFEVSAWLDDPWQARRILSKLNESIWWALKKNGIVIPFPQRDVHLVAPGVTPLPAAQGEM